MRNSNDRSRDNQEAKEGLANKKPVYTEHHRSSGSGLNKGQRGRGKKTKKKKNKKGTRCSSTLERFIKKTGKLPVLRIPLKRKKQI